MSTIVARPYCFDWSSVDWRLRDTDIAPFLGCSRERVRQMRLKLRKPKPERYYIAARIEDMDALRQWFKTAPESVGMSGKEIHRLFPQFSRGFICRFAREIGRPVRASRGIKIPLKLLDWRLSNCVLAEIWSCSASRLANYRCELSSGRDLGSRFRRSADGKAAIRSQTDIAQRWAKASPQERASVLFYPAVAERALTALR